MRSYLRDDTEIEILSILGRVQGDHLESDLGECFSNKTSPEAVGFLLSQHMEGFGQQYYSEDEIKIAALGAAWRCSSRIFTQSLIMGANHSEINSHGGRCTCSRRSNVI